MKKISLILSSAFCILQSALSQTSIYHPFPVSDAVWRENRSAEDASYSYLWTEQKFINGDTVIGGNTYHKIYETGILTLSLPLWAGGTFISSNPFYDTYQGAIREDLNHTIYIVLPFHPSEDLLYDFNLSAGDTIQNCYLHSNAITILVQRIDSIFDGADYRKQFVLTGDTVASAIPYTTIIEGIGTTRGLLTTFEPPFDSDGLLTC